MNQSEWSRLWNLAERQHGAFGVGQALELGLSRTVIEDRARAREIERLHRGIYGAPGSTDTDLRRASAALLAVRGEAFLAGRTAAALWGLLSRYPREVELVRATGKVTGRHERVVVRRSRTLTKADQAITKRLRVTSPARTIIDLTGLLDGDELLEAAASALHAGKVSTDSLRDSVARMGTAAGVEALREVIRALETDGRTDSQFERDVRRYVVGLGLTPAPGTYPLRVGGRIIARLDIAFPEQRVCVECDGRRWHSLPEAFDRDRDRWNRIQAQGWTIIHLTYRQFHHDPARFRGQLLSALTVDDSRR
jgi:hypothetical protein